MPGRFLTDAKRNRLSQFPAEISREDCLTSFTLSPEDLVATRHQHGPHNRLGFAMQLGSIRYLGFAPDDLTTAPEVVVSYVSHQVAVDPGLLEQYARRAHTRTDHLKAVLTHLQWRLPTADDLAVLEAWLVERALEHDRPTVLFTLAAERLKSGYIVRPGVTTLERLVAAARERAHAETQRRLAPVLTQQLIHQLNRLLLVNPETNRTSVTWLRQHATASTPDEIMATLDKVRFLQQIGVPEWDLSAIPPNRLRWLAELGKRSTNQAISRMPPARRYPLLVAFLRGMLEEQTDLVIDLVDGCLSGAYHRAEHDLEMFRRQHAKATNQKLHYFALMWRLTLDDAIPDQALRSRIFDAIPRADLERAVTDTQAIIRPVDDHAYDFFTKRFEYVRQFSPQFVTTLRFHAFPEARPLLEAMALIGRPKHPLPATVPVDFVPARWKPYVLPAHANGRANGKVQRAAYEMCLLMAVRDALKSGNVWLEHSRRYAEPASYLLPEAQWEQQREEMCALVQVAPSGPLQLQLRQADLESLLAHAMETLPSERVRIADGALSISPLEAEDLPDRIRALRDWIGGALRLIELGDLLIDVDDDIGFTERLAHAGGQQARVRGLKTYLYAAILAQACNYGLTRMAQMADLSYDRLLWVTEWYLREETLKAADAAIVNAHYRLPLSQRWGSGIWSSSDGQRFAVPVKAHNARALPRYFVGKGVTFYTWTSDQLSQYGTKVTTVTMRDAPYVLDEILDNVTELPIQEHAVDTSGVSALVFCFFDLLGLRLSPRIKDLADRWIYRMDRGQHYVALEPLLKGTINQQLILAHYDELLRLAGSLKYGHVSASLLLTKLQANVRQNALAQAAHEYGLLVRSIFILRVLLDEEYRRHINTQLNKGESLHSLRRFLYCANESLVRKREPEEQLHQALCLTLVTNAVVYWNTLYLDEAVQARRARGDLVQEEDLAHIYPIHYAHINTHGKLHFPTREDTAPRQRQRRPLRDPDATRLPRTPLTPLTPLRP